jgi:hypothetical protein
MAVSPISRRLSSDFRLGGLQAEADPLLEKAFYESGHYKAAERRDDPRCFVIGRTGSGKSAILRHLESSYPSHVIRIEPENLALQYITDLGVIKYLASIEVNLDSLFTALWRHVFLVEVIKHRYKVDSAAAKQNFMLSLTDRIKKDPSKQLALKYLDEFEGKFWCETDERVRDVTTRFEEQIDAEAKASFGVAHVASLSTSINGASAMSTETRAAQVNRFQRVVNETQLARLSKMITVLDEDILESPQNFVYVIIDDLDREWVDERIANTLIRCLFRAVRDLKRVRHLKIVVALRTNIFQELGLGHHPGEQVEKFRDWIIRMRWTPADILTVLDERARIVSSEYDIPNIVGIKNLLPAPNNRRGNPIRFILDRTLMRPRDAIDYLNECLSFASGKSRISWDEVSRAERPYSQGRLSALSDEWSGTYPGIAEVFNCFRHAPVPMTRDELTERLDDVVMPRADSSLEGVQWRTDLAESVLKGMAGQEWADAYQPLLRLLFNLGFLGFSKSRSLAATYLNDDPDFANYVGNLADTQSFLIHPAFTAALDVHHVAVG